MRKVFCVATKLRPIQPIYNRFFKTPPSLQTVWTKRYRIIQNKVLVTEKAARTPNPYFTHLFSVQILPNYLDGQKKIVNASPWWLLVLTAAVSQPDGYFISNSFRDLALEFVAQAKRGQVKIPPQTFAMQMVYVWKTHLMINNQGEEWIPSIQGIMNTFKELHHQIHRNGWRWMCFQACFYCLRWTQR